MNKRIHTDHPMRHWDRTCPACVAEEQEPVKCTCGYAIGHPLVTSCSCKPRKEWVGLTDEEIDELNGSPMALEHSAELKWVRTIEAKLKEKNK